VQIKRTVIMRSRKRLLVVCLLVVAAVVVKAQADAHIGTWKMNPAKSKAPQEMALKSQTRTYAAYGDGLRVTIDSVNADGSKTAGRYSAHFDGKENPYSGMQAYDTIALKKLDANTMEATLKKSGKVVQTARNVVSKDGKVMTVTANGTDAKGKKYTTVTVLDKQ
jgi:hypothetical protein